MTSLGTHNLGKVNSFSGFHGTSQLVPTTKSSKSTKKSQLDEMSSRTQRKAGFYVDLVRVGMWYELAGIRF